MAFLPNNFQPPAQGGNYLKLKEGVTRFRPVGDGIQGRIFWQANGDKRTPIRRRMDEPIAANELEVGDDGQPEKVKEFFTFAVLDRADGKVKVLELVQAGIIGSIFSLFESDDWGDPSHPTTGYDLSVSRHGAGLETKYATMPCPKKPLSKADLDAIAAAPVNLDALFSGGDPFAATGPAKLAQATQPQAAATGKAQRTSVKITDVKSASGETNGQKWTKYGVVASDGRVYGSYAKGAAEFAKVRVADQQVCHLDYAVDDNKLTLLEITLAGPAFQVAAGGQAEPGSDVEEDMNPPF